MENTLVFRKEEAVSVLVLMYKAGSIASDLQWVSPPSSGVCLFTTLSPCSAPQLRNFRIKFSPRKLKTVWRILSGHLKINSSGKASTSQTTVMSFQQEQGSL